MKYKKFIRIIISQFLFFLLRKDLNRRNWSKIRDLHKGERAFLICNGPSLKPEDLDKIHSNGDISIASNKIDRIFLQTNWRPTYYCCADEGLQYQLLETFNNIPAKIKFFRKNSFCTTIKVHGLCLFFDADGRVSLLDNPNFSEDAGKVVYTIGTVTYAMMQILVHMGIREIYIIGCDNSYSVIKNRDGSISHSGKASYFAGSDTKDMGMAAAVWQMDIAYEYANRYGKEHGIKIFNATRGGHLEAFDRVDFDSLFKQ